MENIKTNLREKVLSFLKSQYIMSVAVTKDDKPTSAILLYHIDDDFNFYFATHTDSYKAMKLLANPYISLSVWEFGKMLVQADGTAEEVKGDTEKLSVIDKIAESSVKGENFWPPLFRIKGKDYIVFKIRPTWMRMLDLEVDTMTQENSPLYDVEIN